MKILTIIIRVLIGLLLLFASISYFLKLPMDVPKMSDEMIAFNTGLAASKYMLPLVKTVELLCGIAFLLGRFVTLANIVILPITLNILLVHIFMGPENLPIAAALFISNLFLIYSYWSNYWGVFAVK